MGLEDIITLLQNKVESEGKNSKLLLCMPNKDEVWRDKMLKAKYRKELLEELLKEL